MLTKGSLGTGAAAAGGWASTADVVAGDCASAAAVVAGGSASSAVAVAEASNGPITASACGWLGGEEIESINTSASSSGAGGGETFEAAGCAIVAGCSTPVGPVEEFGDSMDIFASLLALSCNCCATVGVVIAAVAAAAVLSS